MCPYPVVVPFPESTFTRAPAVPRLALCLRILAREVDARWPDRATRSDGWIGDVRHQSLPSDHNPDADGIVHALDITTAGIMPLTLVHDAIEHPATEYVIYSGRIWSRSHNFRARTYSGDDPHVSHVHLSVRHAEVFERSRRRWLRPTR